jgi:hypothetical protein
MQTRQPAALAVRRRLVAGDDDRADDDRAVPRDDDRDRAACGLRRWAAGISAWATARVSAGIWRSSSRCIFSSSRR